MSERRTNRTGSFIAAALAISTLLSAATSVARSGAGEADMLGTAWLAEDIGGRDVVDGARSTMEFVKPGQVGGLASCNRYFGAVVLDGGTIAFGNLAATRKLCTEPLMVQEQRFLKALAQAKRLDLTHEGQILLMYADGTEPVLRFSRIVDK
jgi:heat shock protein HslJ